MIAAILCAGAGTRMAPFTPAIPKVMLPVANKPFLQFTIETLKKIGVKEIILVVSPTNQDYIQSFFKDTVRYVVQHEQNGTAHAIGILKDFIDDTFILLNGDNLYTFKDLSDFIKLAKEKNNAVMAVFHTDFPQQYGIIQIENDHVIDVIEKPENPPSNLANAGLYLFPIEIFSTIEKTPLSPRNEYEFTDSIKIYSQEGLLISPYILKDSFKDFGSPWHIIDINKYILSNNDYKSIIAEINNDCLLGKNLSLGKNTHINNFTTIGNNVQIGDNCKITSSLIMDNVIIEDNCEIYHCVVGKNAHIETNCVFNNSKDNNDFIYMKIKGKNVNTGKKKMGSIVAHNVKVPAHSHFNPGTIIS